MARKWDVNKAVKESSLPPSSRLIMFALSDVADTETAIIPPDRTPSLIELAVWTGLDKSTVTRHLNTLEEAGWVVRDRPDTVASRTQHVRTGYQLAIGRGAPRTTESPEQQSPQDNPGVHHATSQSGQSDKGLGAPHTTDGGAPRTTARGAPRTTSLFPDTSQSKNHSSPGKTQRPKKPPKAKPGPKPHRADVDKICNHLADRIAENGSLRPTISKSWLTEARLLLDKDGRTVEQVLRAIDWCQDDTFWRANIMSMPKLRAKYDQLRLAAKRTSTPARRDQLTEVNGVHLKPANVEALARQQRLQALQAQQDAQTAIGGAP